MTTARRGASALRAGERVPEETLPPCCSLHGRTSRRCRTTRAAGAAVAMDGSDVGVTVPDGPLVATPEASGEPAQAAAQLGVSYIVLITGLPPPFQARRPSRWDARPNGCLRERAYAGGENPGKVFLTCDFGASVRRRCGVVERCAAGLRGTRAGRSRAQSSVTRMSPSCTTETTRSPSWVNTSPRAKPRAPAAAGVSWAYSSHWSARNGLWNHIAWSRLAPMVRLSPQASPWLSSTVSSKVMSDAYVIRHTCNSGSSGRSPSTRSQTRDSGDLSAGSLAASHVSAVACRTSNGRRRTKRSAISSPNTFAIRSRINGSVSGSGASGIGAWCAGPDSGLWNGADSAKNGFPCWVAV